MSVNNKPLRNSESRNIMINKLAFVQQVFLPVTVSVYAMFFVLYLAKRFNDKGSLIFAQINSNLLMWYEISGYMAILFVCFCFIYVLWELYQYKKYEKRI